MSGFPRLDTRHAEWDKFRDAVVIPSGIDQVVVTLDALQGWVNRDLTPDEAVETAVDESALLRAVANATPSVDNVILITNGVLNSRSWSVEEYDDGPDDSGPIYLQNENSAGGDYQ